MARKETRVTITTEGRDRGKVFVIREAPADQGFRWVCRAMLALSRGGIDVPPGIFEAGFAGLAALLPYLIVIGLKSLHGAQWAEIEPLLDEMMGCVKYQPPGVPAPPLQEIFPGENAQYEEMATKAELLREVAKLHVGFSLADALSTSEPPPSAPQSA